MAHGPHQAIIACKISPLVWPSLACPTGSQVVGGGVGDLIFFCEIL